MFRNTISSYILESNILNFKGTVKESESYHCKTPK